MKYVLTFMAKQPGSDTTYYRAREHELPITANIPSNIFIGDKLFHCTKAEPSGDIVRLRFIEEDHAKLDDIR